jgi:hypothetical protein
VITKSGLKSGDPKSLLHTAWPALRSDFEEALGAREQTGNVIAFPTRSASEEVLDIAAGADPEDDASRPKLLLLHRLPAEIDLSSDLQNVAFARATTQQAEPSLVRPEGSRDARRKGSVVHALLEHLSRGAALESLRDPARTLLRGLAYSGKVLDDAMEEALKAARNCANDPDGAWILSPHPQAQSEASWTGWHEGTLETLRADRVFVAGTAPHAHGEDHLWIVDYKMSAPSGDANFLAHQRAIYAPQLVRYADALREARGIALRVRFGLYYPRIPKLDWWAAEEGNA